MTTAEERRLDELTEQQDDEVLTAERAAAAAAAGGLDRELTVLLAAAVVAYEAAEDDDRSALLAALSARLRRIEPSVAAALQRHFVAALDLGGRQAMAQLGLPGTRTIMTGLPAEVRDVLWTIDGNVRADIAAGADLLVAGSTVDDIETAFARARGGVRRVEQAATWGVNRAVATGVTAVATEAGASRLWVGERDACLHCLAYFGQVAAAGAEFAGGLTFGDRPLSYQPVPNPPLHPFCRCRIVAWFGEWGSAGGQDYPAALAREARRSVARGWSLTSESNASRLRAAERLLREASGLPKSVLDYAANAVKRGAFPRGRTFPN